MSCSILSLLSQDSFLIINKEILRSLGGDPLQAIILSELVTLANAFKATDQMKYNSGWFFRSIEDMERDTAINEYKQRSAISALEEKGFIETKRAGRPAKRFFRINEKKIIEILTCIKVEDIEENISKKEIQEEFYKEINESIPQGFDVFKTKIRNIKKPFAVFMYTWSVLYNKRFGRNWVWDPASFGKLSIHWRKSSHKDFDYSNLAMFFEKIIDLGNEIPKWIEYSKNIFEKAPNDRILDPRVYWKEEK